MAEPYGAKVFGGKKPVRMDPQEILDFSFDYRADGKGALIPSDNLDTLVSVVPTTDASALGLEILTGAKAADIVGDKVVFWAQIKSGSQADAAWDGTGTRIGVEVTVTTTEGRTFQDTGLIEVAHK